MHWTSLILFLFSFSVLAQDLKQKIIETKGHYTLVYSSDEGCEQEINHAPVIKDELLQSTSDYKYIEACLPLGIQGVRENPKKKVIFGTYTNGDFFIQTSCNRWLSENDDSEIFLNRVVHAEERVITADLQKMVITRNDKGWEILTLDNTPARIFNSFKDHLVCEYVRN